MIQKLESLKLPHKFLHSIHADRKLHLIDSNIICLSQANLCLKGYIRLQKVMWSGFEH